MPTRLSAAAFSLAVVLAAVTSALAEDAEALVDCANATSTHVFNICGERALEKADSELNAAYAKVLVKVTRDAADPPFDAKTWDAKLRVSQRAWIAFRDADCKELVPMAWTGGSGASAEVLGCLEAKTHARTKELLERYLLE